VEGEPDAVTGHELGLTAFGTPGTNGWRTSWAQRFRGRVCVVCFDCDQPGRTAARKVAGSLIEEAREVRVVDLAPERDDGFDLSDFVLGGGTVRDLLRLAVGSPAVRSLRSAA
jgi:DNA primase